MPRTDVNPQDASAVRPSKDRRRGLAGLLSSVPFASSVVAAIAAACVLGTLLPQGSQVDAYVRKHPESERLMSLLTGAGLTRVFSAWWFTALLLLLAASLSVCTYRRYGAAMRLRGRPRGRALGSMVTHLSMLLILAGGVIRVVWGERGDVEFTEGETARAFASGDRMVPLPFGIRLVDFQIETYAESNVAAAVTETLHARLRAGGGQWELPVAEGAEKRLEVPGRDGAAAQVFLVRVLQRIPDFVVNPSTGKAASRSDQLRNPALRVEVVHGAVTNAQWVFALHPDFNLHGGSEAAPLDLRYVIRGGQPPGRQMVKDYRSTLEVLDGDTVVKKKTIEVNDPLSFGGYTFYQSGYNPDDPTWTSLSVVRDPGVPLVYTGFILLIAGLTVVFYLYPHGRHED